MYAYINGKHKSNIGVWGPDINYSWITFVRRVEPTIKAILEITNPNTTVNVGEIELAVANAPVIVDWGDGNVEYRVGEVPTGHTYVRTGTYTIVVTTLAKGIGSPRGIPFISIEGSRQNDMLRTFEFTDFVGIEKIGSDCFANCPNLNRIECVVTTGYDEEKLTEGGVWLSDCPRVLYAPLDYYGFRSMANFPFGYSGSTDDIIGIDGLPAAYMTLTLSNVEGQHLLLQCTCGDGRVLPFGGLGRR